MDYNKFAYYRANPYAKDGFIPPTGHINRHQSDFLTQIPQGEEHLAKIGKRIFYDQHRSSNILDEGILKSPQRYPYENRIALEKKYERNMNTIDIQGAYSGSFVNQAIRNKQKGRQSISQRLKQSGDFSQLNNLSLFQHKEEEKRRKMAFDQYLKNKQTQQLNAGYPFHTNDEKNKINEEMYKRKINNSQLPAPNKKQLTISHSNTYDLNPEQKNTGYKKEQENLLLSKSEILNENYKVPLAMERSSLRKANPTHLSYNSSSLWTLG